MYSCYSEAIVEKDFDGSLNIQERSTGFGSEDLPGGCQEWQDPKKSDQSSESDVPVSKEGKEIGCIKSVADSEMYSEREIIGFKKSQ